MKRWLWLVPFFLLLLPFRGDAQFVGSPSGIVVGSTTIAQLGTPAVGSLRVITNGSDGSDCTIGGGSTLVLCWYNGTVWSAVGGGTNGWPTVITGAAATSESAPIKIFGQGGQAAFGAALFQHSSGTFFWECVVAAGQNNCDYYRQLDAGFNSGVKDSGGNIINKVAEAAPRFPICGSDLAALNPADGVAAHVWDKDPLSTAPTATAVNGTNQSYGVIVFPDSDGEYGVQITCEVPGIFVSIDAAVWVKTGGTGNMRLRIQTICYASDEAPDSAYSNSSYITAAAGTSGRLNRYTWSNITATGCAENELLRVRFSRNRTEASDTLTGGTVDAAKLLIYGRVAM